MMTTRTSGSSSTKYLDFRGKNNFDGLVEDLCSMRFFGFQVYSEYRNFLLKRVEFLFLLITKASAKFGSWLRPRTLQRISTEMVHKIAMF